MRPLDHHRSPSLHEAGHAVARIVYGCRIKSIEIDGGDGLTTVLQHRSRPLTPLQTAVCCLAGPSAEFLFCGTADYKAQKEDVLMARDLVRISSWRWIAPVVSYCNDCQDRPGGDASRRVG